MLRGCFLTPSQVWHRFRPGTAPIWRSFRPLSRRQRSLTGSAFQKRTLRQWRQRDGAVLTTVGFEEKVNAAREQQRIDAAREADEKVERQRQLAAYKASLKQALDLVADAEALLKSRRGRGWFRAPLELSLGRDLVRISSGQLLRQVDNKWIPLIDFDVTVDSQDRVRGRGWVSPKDDGSGWWILAYTGAHRNTEQHALDLEEWLASEVARLTDGRR